MLINLVSFQWVLFMLGVIVKSQTVCKDNDNDPCKCDLINGKGVVDLTFGQQDGNPLFSNVIDPSGDYAYSYNPCYAFAAPDGSINGLAVLDYYSSGTGYSDIGQQSTSAFILDGDNLFINYTSSDGYFSSGVQLVCLKSGKNVLTAYGASGYHYSFVLTGPDVCSGSSSSKGGLSGGSILLIICTVLIFVYLVAGMIYNKKRKDASGTDMIPNKEFWTSLPGLIKDGFMFFVHKCKGTSTAPTSYDNI